jgi:hypothetical protein
MHPNPVAIAYRDAGRLLASMLESEEGKERDPGRFFIGGVDTQDSALFFRVIVKAAELHRKSLPALNAHATGSGPD